MDNGGLLERQRHSRCIQNKQFEGGDKLWLRKSGKEFSESPYHFFVVTGEPAESPEDFSVAK